MSFSRNEGKKSGKICSYSLKLKKYKNKKKNELPKSIFYLRSKIKENDNQKSSTFLFLRFAYFPFLSLIFFFFFFFLSFPKISGKQKKKATFLKISFFAFKLISVPHFCFHFGQKENKKRKKGKKEKAEQSGTECKKKYMWKGLNLSNYLSPFWVLLQSPTSLCSLF